MLNGECIDPEPNMRCHKKLRSLNIANIYTFNYDNALDIIAGTDKADIYYEVITNASHDISLLKKIKKEYNIYNSTDRIEINDTIETINKKDFKTFKSYIYSLNHQLNSSLNIFKENTAKYTTDDLPIIDKRINECIYERDKAENDLNSVYQLIKNGYQISLTEKRNNIYKLHGSLRLDPLKEDFGFDGDKHKQYIITKEDYEEYPSKHEAFVNLMKVSLLKGRFCLVGFSCDDPNFLMWMKWVKDVLDKNPEKSKKIYFINLEKDPLNEDKLLFLDNNYIKPVNLKDIFSSAKDDEECIFEFLKSIGNNKNYDYNDKWNNIDVSQTFTKIKSADNDEDIDSLYDLSDYNRVPTQIGFAKYNRKEVYVGIDNFLQSDTFKPSLSMAKLLYSAIKGEMMPLDMVLTEKSLTCILTKTDEKLKKRFELLELRSKILNHKEIEKKCSDENVQYEVIWNALFTMQFSEAFRLLKKWDPDEYFNKVRKAMLLSLFGKRNTKEINQMLLSNNYDCLQDYRFALDILPKARGFIYGSPNDMISFKNDIKERIETLDRGNPQLIKIYDVFESLISIISEKKEIHKYGNSRQTITLGSDNNALESSVKVMQIFIELGFSTKVRNIILFGENKWLQVCENLYERYPYPALYFTLQYGNSKELITKVAQNYIYNPKVYKYVSKILCSSLKAILDEKCPSNIKLAIYIAAPIFMRAVKTKKWQKTFEKIYKEIDFEDKDSRENDIFGKFNFLLEGVKHLDDEALTQYILLDSLRKGKDVDNFFNEIIIAASKNLKSLDDEIGLLVNNLLKEADTSAQFYVLFNMEKLLNKDDLLNKFLSLPDNKYTDATLLEATCFLSKDSSVLHNKLQKIIIDSDLLWYTGIVSDKEISFNGWNPIDINYVQKNIAFEPEQISEIYEKMLLALNALNEVIKNGILYSWKTVLAIMLNFVNNNRTVLKEKPSLIETRSKIKSLYNISRGGNNIKEMLIDDEKIGSAIESLVNDVYNNGAKKYQDEYTLLANIIILKSSKRLNSCINHFTWVITTYTKDMNKDIFKPLLKDILKSYEPYFVKSKFSEWDLQYAEKDIVERKLRKIYRVYVQWGGYYYFWDKYKPLYNNDI